MTSSVLDWLVLPTIVFAQFAGTSLWFAPNAVVSLLGFDAAQSAALVSCVQAGFILGTLALTYFAVADRVSPPFLFCCMTLIGAALNVICIFSTNFVVWVVVRTLIGFMLAGVYPVGMKIAAVEYPNGLGARLGVLVGALTLGTAFPWLIRGIGDESGLPYQATIGAVSVLATIGAVNMALVMIPRQGGPGAEFLGRILACCLCDRRGKEEDEIDNEHVADVEETPLSDVQNVRVGDRNDASNVIESEEPSENESTKLDVAEASQQEDESEEQQLTGIAAIRALFSDSRFRAAAIGYVGHMWELYAFWAWVPSLIDSHSANHSGVILGNEALTSFTTIAIGSVSSVAAGVWSLYAGRQVLPGSAVAAEVPLSISLVCCLLAPVYQSMSQGVFLFYLLVWGSTVVADSAQFSSLCATYAYPASLVGTALTMTTCIGFATTVVSIQTVGALLNKRWDPGNALALLVIGPFFGLARSYKEWPLHWLLCPGRRRRKTLVGGASETKPVDFDEDP